MRRRFVSLLFVTILFSANIAKARLCQEVFSSEVKVSFFQRIKNFPSVVKSRFQRNSLPANNPIVRRKSPLRNSVGFLGKNKEYLDMGRLVKALEEGRLSDNQLAGTMVKIPKALGLRKSLREGRIVHLKNPKGKPKAVVFLVGGLFNGAEKILTRKSFIKEQLDQGVDVVYLEMTKGLTAAKEIVNNKGKSPSIIPHKEQQKLLAYYLLRAISDLGLPASTPKALMGHSYGGWLVNRFASNPEFNGSRGPRNAHLRELLDNLKERGLIAEASFKDVYGHLIPLDAGLGSLHLVHPTFAQLRDQMAKNFSFFDKLEDFQVEQIMRTSLEKAVPQLKQDPLKLDNAVALFLGIRQVTVLNAPESIPSRIRIHDIVAGGSELIPPAWHRHYYYSLRESSQNPHHRSSILLKDAPHDFLGVKGVGRLLADIILGQLPMDKHITEVSLSANGRREVESLESFPSLFRGNLVDIIIEQQNTLFGRWLRLNTELFQPQSSQ